MLATDPLFGPARKDVKQLLPVWMRMESVAACRLDGDANHEQLFVRNHVFAAEPLFESPGRLALDLFGSGHKAAVCGLHEFVLCIQFIDPMRTRNFRSALS